VLASESKAFTRKAMDLALVGRTIPMTLCLERILPPRWERTVTFAMLLSRALQTSRHGEGGYFTGRRQLRWSVRNERLRMGLQDAEDGAPRNSRSPGAIYGIWPGVRYNHRRVFAADLLQMQLRAVTVARAGRGRLRAGGYVAGGTPASILLTAEPLPRSCRWRGAMR
jgi:hypothetical protein